MWKQRWQDGVTLIAGLWFAIAPWVFCYDFAENRAVLYNAVIIGAALVLFSAGALAKPDAWEEVVDFLLGIWAIASPWVLGYSTMRGLTLNAVAVGLIVAVLALWTAADRSHVVERMHLRR